MDEWSLSIWKKRICGRSVNSERMESYLELLSDREVRTGGLNRVMLYSLGALNCIMSFNGNLLAVSIPKNTKAHDVISKREDTPGLVVERRYCARVELMSHFLNKSGQSRAVQHVRRRFRKLRSCGPRAIRLLSEIFLAQLFCCLVLWVTMRWGQRVFFKNWN